MQRVVIIDYGSGNLHSAAKAFERASRESSANAEIIVSAKAEDVCTADRVVLPGVGAFADCRAGLARAAARGHDATEGFVTTDDGVQLYYVKAGQGAETVILPARLFTFADFRWLADRYTLIAYDMRNRGKSSRIEDLAQVSIEADVADLEAIRRQFAVEKFHTIGYSYLGLMVVLYTLEHPERVAERLRADEAIVTSRNVGLSCHS